MRTYLTLIILLFNLYCFAQNDFSLQMQNGHTLPINSVALHPSEPILATGSQDHSIIIWNSKTQIQLATINVSNSSIQHLEFDPSGSKLLILNIKDEVIIYDYKTDREINRKTFKINLGYVNSASFSTFENKILIGSDRDDLIIWDFSNDQIILSTKAYKSSVNANYLSQNQEQYLNLKGATSFQLISSQSSDTLEIPFSKAHHYQFNPTNDLLAVGSTKLFTQIFDTKSGKEIAYLEPNKEAQCDGCNTQVFWSPDGTQLATYEHKNGLFVWGKDYTKPSFSLEIKERINYASFSPSGKYISLSNDNELWIIDADKKKLILNIKNKYLQNYQVIFSSDEQTIYVPGNLSSLEELKVSNGTKVAVFNGVNNQPSNQLPYDYLNWNESGSLRHFKQLSPLAVSNKKDFVLFGKIGLEVQKLDLNTGYISSPIQSEKTITSICLSSDDSLIAVGDAQGNVSLYNAHFDLIHAFKNLHYGMVFSFSFLNNHQLLTTGWDGRTYSINLNSHEKTLITEVPNATNIIKEDGQNLYYFKCNLDHSIVMHESDSHLEVRRFIGHLDKVTDLIYDNISGVLYSSSLDGTIRIWDISSGLLHAKYYLKDRTPALSIAKHPEKSILQVGGIDRKIYSIDLQQKNLKVSPVVLSSGIANLDFLDKTTLIARGLDGSVEIIDFENLTNKLSIYLYPNNEWLAIEPENFHFEGTKVAMEQIHLIKGNEAQNIGDFFNVYFSPNLIKEVITGNFKNKDQGRNIDAFFNSDYSFDLAFLNNQNDYHQPVKDSVYQLTSSIASFKINFQEKVNYQDVFIYNNGKLVITASSDEEVAFRGVKNTLNIEIPLTPLENKIEIKVLDKNQIQHSYFPVHLNFDTIAAKPDLFLLCLGINQYENKSYNLKYAKGDATEFSSTLTNSAQNLFANTYTFSLEDKKVTKENVLNLVNEIAKNISSEDVFVFYYAGHGVMIESQANENDFFLVMSDITNLYGGNDMLRDKGISAKELLNISKNISAQKQVFFLDACQSGAALDAFATRGVSREKTIAQLARSSGTFFITASQDVEYANEASSLEHGLFTYSLLEVLSGKATIGASEIISVNRLKTYVEQRVPELSAQFKTSPQYPTGYSFGNDFPIGVLDSKK